MTVRKIILHSLHGYRPALDALVETWIQEGVKYVGVVGVDASKVQDIISELCVGDGSAGAEPYFMMTAFHQPDETVEDAIALAEQISDEFGTGTTVVEL